MTTSNWFLITVVFLTYVLYPIVLMLRGEMDSVKAAYFIGASLSLILGFFLCLIMVANSDLMDKVEKFNEIKKEQQEQS